MPRSERMKKLREYEGAASKLGAALDAKGGLQKLGHREVKGQLKVGWTEHIHFCHVPMTKPPDHRDDARTRAGEDDRMRIREQARLAERER